MSEIGIMLNYAKPHVPATDEHADQRYFGSRSSGRQVGMQQQLSTPDVSVRVYRNAYRNTAELKISIWPFGGMGLLLTPDELRDLARDLVSAAHDIEQNPPLPGPAED